MLKVKPHATYSALHSTLVSRDEDEARGHDPQTLSLPTSHHIHSLEFFSVLFPWFTPHIYTLWSHTGKLSGVLRGHTRAVDISQRKLEHRKGWEGGSGCQLLAENLDGVTYSIAAGVFPSCFLFLSIALYFFSLPLCIFFFCFAHFKDTDQHTEKTWRRGMYCWNLDRTRQARDALVDRPS